MTARSLPILAAILVPASAGAAGFYLPNQDAFATAKGNAWVATADSAAAVHYNAAGLTQLEEPEAQIGVYAINLGHSFNNGGADFEAKSEWQYVPSIFYAQPIRDDLAWGFGVNSPWGLGTEWGQGSPFRTVVTEARLAYISATVALAYDLTDTISVGLSGSGNYADLTLEQGLGVAPLDFLRFEGDGTSFSGALSVRWQPHEQHAFGLNVVSDTSMDLSGKVYSNILGSGPADIDFVTPLRIAGGYSFRPAPGWNVEANIEWLDWDSLNSLYLRSPALPGGATGVPFHWKSMFIYEAGVSYTMDNGYAFAVGYDYNSNAQPDTFFNPSVADADRHWFNAGFGRKCEDWGWFIAYQFGYSNRDVRGALPTPAGQSANGKYESRHHSVSLSANYSF
jgi:long-chain fatty acid transport protein